MKSWLTTLTLAVMTLAASAQEEESAYSPWHIYLNGNFQLGIPIESFRQNLDRTGFGGGGLLLLQIKRLPVYGGLELSGITYDSESIRYAANVGGFNQDYKLVTRNNIFLGHAVVRFQPPVNFLIQPYVDGMVGFKNLYTRTTLQNQDTEESDGETDQHDWAFSYGGAAGIQLYLFKNKAICIDLRCAYVPGANAKYLIRRDDTNGPFNDPLDAFRETASPTTILMPQIGVTIDLTTVERYD